MCEKKIKKKNKTKFGNKSRKNMHVARKKRNSRDEIPTISFLSRYVHIFPVPCKERQTTAILKVQQGLRLGPANSTILCASSGQLTSKHSCSPVESTWPHKYSESDQLGYFAVISYPTFQLNSKVVPKTVIDAPICKSIQPQVTAVNFIRQVLSIG